MAVATFTKTGSKATTAAKLPEKVFSAEIKHHHLLRQAYETQLANGRSAAANTKARGEVRGGGAKPWRQKGTGRARAGSKRSPLWRGGGITFGPTGLQNYGRKLNLKAKRAALRQALTLKAQANTIKVVENFESKDGKVKPCVKLLEKLEARGKVLVVIHEANELITRATRNIVNVKLLTAKRLNICDVMDADLLVVTQPSLGSLNEWLGGEK